MKSSVIQHNISCPLLKFIRDTIPSEPQLLEWLETPERQAHYHILRKARVVILENGQVSLSPYYLSDDGKTICWDNIRYYLDEDRIDIYRVR